MAIGISIQRRISVIGAGPAGLALAAEIESHGYQVLVYAHPAHTRNAARITNRGIMNISGIVTGSTSPKFTFDISDVVDFSNVIILTVPSTAQETVLMEFKPFCLRKHMIIAIPGNMFSLVAETVGVPFGCILETNLSPYSCRLTEQGDLIVLGKKRLFHIATMRDNPSADFKQSIASIFPGLKLKWCVSIAEVCLNNVNGIFHPLLMLMNAGRIESTNGDFLFYRDGLTQSVASAMSALDQVRVEIGQALGLQLQSALKTSNECYGHSFADMIDLALYSTPHNSLQAPAGIENRNIFEDVPDILVFWHDLAIKLGVDASPIAAVIYLARMATGTDFMQEGRSLEKLKLDHYSGSELVERFGSSNLECKAARKLLRSDFSDTLVHQDEADVDKTRPECEIGLA